MTGPCAKTVVRCTLVFPEGRRVVGENSCANPQPACPREPGEDYLKCKTICRQDGHAEVMAVMAAGGLAVGAHAYVEGNTYACRNCQETLFGAGAAALTVGPPPAEPTVPQIPEPPFPIGAATNCKRVGWTGYFMGKPRQPSPFPEIRADLHRGYEEGWDAAKVAKEGHQ